ncbi:DNA-binding transcriptional regulator AraC [Delftia tsuruhatensis]|uniref:AraC family transcriptional regulator n=1 Tax=Delftia tsuruhatensis TaxID=180282 RepID=UPI001E76B4AD|nr:helix-turn-helix domain-containing protein [Delftia tsuruhatensis]CAB5690585.1 DNA-binding transcriptional regulator AraC [Delftia tsuruhatensis]CAC9677006.1 DNA-binding transcriptional regulator AraC [Delftia tsuruhatensis]
MPPQPARLEIALPRPEPQEPRVMWLNADRAVYSGLLGQPRERCLGGHAIYFSLRGSHRVRIADGAWQHSSLSIVPPYVRHGIEASERTICNLLIEAETLDARQLPPPLRGDGGAVHDAPLLERMRDGLARLLPLLGHHAPGHGVGATDFDRIFFGEPLRAPALDRRVQAIIDKVKADPSSPSPALRCASDICLSESRFLHLFSQETGVPFRRFKTWKRARAFLGYVTQDMKLTDVALDAGYPDATHFSHSIRQIYGLTPKSIFAGSRKLTVFAGAGTR